MVVPVVYSRDVLLPGGSVSMPIGTSWMRRTSLRRLDRIAVVPVAAGGSAAEPVDVAELHPIGFVGIGRIDGVDGVGGVGERLELRVRGVARGCVVEEVARAPVQLARVERSVETSGPVPAIDDFARRELLASLRHAFEMSPWTALVWDRLTGLDAPLDVLTDELAFRLGLSFETRHRLLVETRAHRRAAILAEVIDSLSWRDAYAAGAAGRASRFS